MGRSFKVFKVRESHQKQADSSESQSEETHRERRERQNLERDLRAARRAQQLSAQLRASEVKKDGEARIVLGRSRVNKGDNLPLEEKLMDREELLSKLENYNERYRQRNSFELPELDPNILQVKDMTREEVIQVLAQYEKQESTSYRPYMVPSRSPSNACMDSRCKRFVVKRRRLIIRNPCTQKYLATSIALKFIMNLCKDDITSDLRFLYYSRRDVFKSMRSVSAVIDDICCMIGSTRSSLRVTACEKGVVIGNISFKEGEDQPARNANDSGKNGIYIPSMTKDVTIEADSDALFILIVEKHTVWSRLAEDEFHNKYRCIMITAKATPGVRLLGILHNHLQKYPLRAKVKLKMSSHDRKSAKRMLATDHLDNLDEELKYMLEKGIKLELEAFASFSVRYWSRVYLHLELQSLCEEEAPS
ncbi:hypothetical protein ACLB2K_009923 [Fragaria x ananassa]